jgi:hypothetical protein
MLFWRRRKPVSMSLRWILTIVILLCGWGLLMAQRPWREYPAIEYSDFFVPPDANVPHEWTRARLKYPDVFGGEDFGPAAYWTMDYPRSDRHLLPGIARLTRIDARSVEQVVELDGSDDIYNWPSLYAVEVGHWKLPEKQAKQLRDYLDRGGFLMVDDFHGDTEWSIFMDSLSRVFPERRGEVLAEDLPDSSEMFHTLYDLQHRVQIPGANAWQQGLTYEQPEDGGRNPHWRAVHDGRNRVVVAISHDMDLGDAWEHADDPWYPEAFTGLAYRIAINYIVYDMSH